MQMPWRCCSPPIVAITSGARSIRSWPKGKLRLLYEASPLAFIVEQAGGAATDGTRRILDIAPTELHQRTPLFIGSQHDVETAREFLRS